MTYCTAFIVIANRKFMIRQILFDFFFRVLQISISYQGYFIGKAIRHALHTEINILII